MKWIQRISRLSQPEKEGFFRLLIPASLFHKYWIDPISFCDDKGNRVVKLFCPPNDNTCLLEIRLTGLDDPLFSIQVSDTSDSTQLDWDFLIVNDPNSAKFDTHINKNGIDTLFGWASRALDEEQRAMNEGLFPGQVRKGLGITREVVKCLEIFCRIFDIKSIRLEALFYHNAITYERLGFSYFSGFKMMLRIHELFMPGGKLHEKMDKSTPFRDARYSQTVGGRSWAIHDGILAEIDDEILEEGWISPVMYKMLEKERAMITFPDPIYW